MRQFIVYRHGWNEANQNPARGLPAKMAVARIEANDAEEACRLAVERVTLRENQRLSAEPAAEVDARQNELNIPATTPRVDV